MSLSSLLRAPLLHLPPEIAHHIAICGLACGLVPSQELVSAPREVGGVKLVNAVGMAAGFDKNGEAVAALFKQGFGFVECGTVTPRAQAGNPKPRLFRLTDDHAVINRMGFNNGGLETLTRNLTKQQAAIETARAKHGQALGINIGKNKDSEDAVADYLIMLRGVAPMADYVTINISSPNTPGLRDLQNEDALKRLLSELLSLRETLPKRVPLWLKLAPDLDAVAIDSIVSVLSANPMDALIVSNTTLSRPDLKSSDKNETGGLSGAPLYALSTTTLRAFAERLGGSLPLIGVGGIANAEDAKGKMAAGASAVQLYSSLVYHGFDRVPAIARAL